MTREIELGKPIYKTFRAEVKEVDVQTGIVEMAIPISTTEMDRDNEIIASGAFKKNLATFMKRPVLVSSHNYYDLRSQIGEFNKLKADATGLFAHGLKYYIDEGNEQADWAFKLAKKGMAAFSVGFIPIKYKVGEKESEPKVTYDEVELLEISQVVVPSNREAIQGVRSKGVDHVTEKLLEEMEKDKELVTKPEETENWLRIPIKEEEGEHDGHRIRTLEIDKDKGIRALYCDQCKAVITYLFDKENGWTMEQAQEWVEEHYKNVIVWIKEIVVNEALEIDTNTFPEWLERQLAKELPAEKDISQANIADELDYIAIAIDQVGLNEDNTAIAWETVRTIMRATGNDIPEDIQEKVGVALKAKNKSRLEEVLNLAQGVLNSAENEPTEPKETVETEGQQALKPGEIKAVVKEVIQELRGQVTK